MDFNCDLGESYGSYKLGFDEKLMPYITSANIACGYHAGDPMWMQRTVALAEKASVAIGAHPGLPDLIGFGRREMKITPEEAKNYVKYQIGALQAFTAAKKLQHVKPHGALYNMGVADKEMARAVAEAVAEFDERVILVGLSGSVWVEAGEEVGLKVAREVFADRALNPDGTLVSRSQAGSVLEDAEQIIAVSLKMVMERKATAIDGREIPIEADTICLHGDTPGAIELAHKLRERMEAAGIQVIPISQFL